MKTSLQRLAAAKALEWAQGKGDVRAVQVDGAPVAVAEAKAALDEVKSRVVAEPGLVDRWVDKVHGAMRGVEDRVSAAPTGKKVIDALAADHERVAKKVQVDVSFADGRTEKVTIEVVDVPASVMLNRLTAASEVLALTPMVGQAFLFLSAVSTQAGAKLAEWQGNAELAEALQRSALKQWVLFGVGWVPGLGSATGALAAVRDWQQQREVSAGPPASVIG